MKLNTDKTVYLKLSNINDVTILEPKSLQFPMLQRELMVITLKPSDTPY